MTIPRLRMPALGVDNGVPAGRVQIADKYAMPHRTAVGYGVGADRKQQRFYLSHAGLAYWVEEPLCRHN